MGNKRKKNSKKKYIAQYVCRMIENADSTAAQPLSRPGLNGSRNGEDGPETTEAPRFL